MKYPSLLTLGLLSSLFSPMRATEPKLEVNRLIACIIEVEQGHWTELGGAGNMSFGAWSDSSDLSYQGSRTESLAMPVYRKHILEKIIPQLKAVNCKVNPQTIGSCWRLGFTGARKVGFKTDEGLRISNLYYDTHFK